MNESFLEKVITLKHSEVEQQKLFTDTARLERDARVARDEKPRGIFQAAVSRNDRVNVIAEIKRASPSKGIINDNVDVAKVAQTYQESGAAAISVLTENVYFGGSMDDLRRVRDAVSLPVLRKDFIVDEFQIFEAAAARADAILLIVAAMSQQRLKALYDLAHKELNLCVLIEVHTLDELASAANIGAKIIGINNRDLSTLEVSLDTSRTLAAHKPMGVTLISESGITDGNEIKELRELGFDAFLVGEALMRKNQFGKLSQWI